MDDYLELAIVMFAYLSVGVLLIGALILFLVCLIRKRRFSSPFCWVDLLFATAIPVLWRYLVPIINPHVDMSGYAMVMYVGVAWSLLIFVRHIAISVFALPKQKAVLWFSMFQTGAFSGGILLSFVVGGC